jgi:hypothetical protein
MPTTKFHRARVFHRAACSTEPDVPQNRQRGSGAVNAIVVADQATGADRLGRDRTPSIPGHELAGVVSALG